MNYTRKYVMIAAIMAGVLLILFFNVKKQNTTGHNQDIVTVDGSAKALTGDDGVQKPPQMSRNILLTPDQLSQVIKSNYPSISSLDISCNKDTCDISGKFATDDASKRDQFTRMVNGGMGRIIIESGYKPASDLKISAPDDSMAVFTTQFYSETGN